MLELRRAAGDAVSLDSPVGEDTHVGDLVSDAGAPEAADLVEHKAFTEELRALESLRDPVRHDRLLAWAG